MKILGFRSRIWSHALACAVFLVLAVVTPGWVAFGCAETHRNYRIWGRSR